MCIRDRIVAAVTEQGQVLEMSRYPSQALDRIRQVGGTNLHFSNVNFTRTGAIYRQYIHSCLLYTSRCV